MIFIVRGLVIGLIIVVITSGFVFGDVFADDIFSEIVITEDFEKRFGNVLALNNDKLFVVLENQIRIYNSNNGDYEKSISIENFKNEHFENFYGEKLDQKQQVSGDFIFVYVVIDPYFSECDRGIAMINYNTEELIHLFTDTELLGYQYGPGVNYSGNFVLEKQICAHNFGMQSEVFDNYLLVTSPQDKGNYLDGGKREYIQKAHVILFDIDEKKILKIFEDVDFIPFTGNRHPEGKPLHILPYTNFGSSLAINSQYIAIGVDHQDMISVYDLKSKELITKIESEKFEEKLMGFGKSIALIDNYLIVSQPMWDSGRILHYELPSGELKNIIRAPSSDHYNFGTSLTAGEKSVFVSQWQFSRYVKHNGITEDQIENVRGKVFQYDVFTGNLIHEFKNNSDTPGHIYNGNLWTDSFGEFVSVNDGRIAISAKGFNNGAVFLFLSDTLSEKDISNTINSNIRNESIVTQPTESKELGIAGFVDKSKDPQHYVDRYHKESSYREWFHENYPQFDTIQQAVGLELTQKIPSWVKNIFGWYAADQVSENELLEAIKYLINQKILVVN